MAVTSGTLQTWSREGPAVPVCCFQRDMSLKFDADFLLFEYIWFEFPFPLKGLPNIFKLPSWCLSFFQIPKLDQVTFPHGTSGARKHWAFAAPSLMLPAPVDDLRCHARYPKQLDNGRLLKLMHVLIIVLSPSACAFWLLLDVAESRLLKITFNPWLACCILVWPVNC